MQTRIFRRIVAAFLTFSFAFGCLVPPAPARADDDVTTWAGWISQALGNSFVEFVALKTEGYTPLNPADLAAFTVAYPTSQAMADQVRSLPAYVELYGSNPLDKSTVIRTYDGGKQVSLLTDEGLYNAFLWLHDGVPPVSSAPSTPEGPISGLPDGVGVIYAENLLYGDYTFADGYMARPSSQSLVDTYNAASAAGCPVMIWSETTATGFQLKSIRYITGSNSGMTAPSGDCGFSFHSRQLATLFNDPTSSEGFAGYSSLSSANSNYTYNGSSYSSLNRLIDNSVYYTYIYGPIGYYRSTSNVGGLSTIHVITNSRVWFYGNWYGGQIGPSLPPASDPVGPSSPDIEQPTGTDVPQSDGPVQDTTINVTVTLPDGSTTIVQAPSVDLLPVVTWLSIINSNLVAWSDTINTTVKDWSGNMSDWLSEIWKTLDAFRQAVDNWAVSILGYLEDIGHAIPSIGGDSVNYWNNTSNYFNTVLTDLPSSDARADMVQNLERLKGRFPFSIPWDILAIGLLFQADPLAPAFDVPLVYMDSSGVKVQQLHVDLSPFDYSVRTWRRLVFVGFALALCFASKKMLDNLNSVSDVLG